MKQNRSQEVSCGFKAWTVSNQQDSPGVLGLSMSQAGALTYAAEGDLSALNRMERCCKGANYKGGGARQQADGRGRAV